MVHVGTYGRTREEVDSVLITVDRVVSRCQQDGPPSKE